MKTYKEFMSEAVVKKSPYASKAVGRLMSKIGTPNPGAVGSTISATGSRARASVSSVVPSSSTRKLIAPLKPKPFNPIQSAKQATTSIIKSKAKKLVSSVKKKLSI
jgi:hypothetical protein